LPESVDAALRKHATLTGRDLTEIVQEGVALVISGGADDSFRAPILTTAPCGPWEQAFIGASHFRVSADVADELGLRDGDFFVRGTGDSMLGVGILDGSIVSMRPLAPHRQPRRGEVALVQITTEDGECLGTIKKWVPGEPPSLVDGDDKPFELPGNVKEIRAIATGQGVIGRL
jgi:hypothetical protein